MGFNNSDYNGGQTFNNLRSRFEEAGMGKSMQFRETESSMRSVMKELEDVRLDPLPLNSKLKKTGLSGYKRSSVEAYVDEMKRSANQLRDNMEQQIQSLSAECMRLKSESKVLRGQLLQAEEQTNQAKDMLAAVTGEREAAENKISFYESEIAKAEELKYSLQRKTDEVDSIAEENIRLKEQIDDFSVKVDRINDEFLKYKDRKAAESAEIAALKQQISSLQEENDALKAELNEVRRELDGKSRRESGKIQSRFFEENAELMERYSNLYAEYKKELARGNSLAHENDAISELLEEYQKNERGNGILGKKQQEQRASIAELQNVIKDLFDEVQHQQEMYDRLSAERSENKGLIYNLTRDRSDLHAQNVDLQVQNVELLDKTEDLSKQVSKLEEENSRLSLLLKQSPSSAALPALQSKQPAKANDLSEEWFSDGMKKAGNIKSYNR